MVAEAIQVLHEVAGQARMPVLMYSIGKHSSMLPHLAQRAFHPGPMLFAVLHIDTKWKFRDMITFHDATAAGGMFSSSSHWKP